MNKLVKKMALILAIGGTMATIPIQTTKAASGKAEIYWFTSTDNGGSGVGPGGSANIERNLKSMGYGTSRYQDRSASSIRSAMSSDVVFANVSHGNAGRIYCNNFQTISAKTVNSDSDNFSLASAYGKNAFGSMKFAYLGSCLSAKTDSRYGNIPSYLTSTLGAKCVLGYTESVSDTQATYFESQLFSQLYNGKTVAQAAANAKSSTYSRYGSYGSIDSYKLYGNSATTIK